MLGKLQKRIVGIMLTTAVLAGCANSSPINVAPYLPPDLMRPPCQMEMPVSDADEDLAVDIRNYECVRQLRLQVYRLQGWARIAAGVAP